MEDGTKRILSPQSTWLGWADLMIGTIGPLAAGRRSLADRHLPARPHERRESLLDAGSGLPVIASNDWMPGPRPRCPHLHCPRIHPRPPELARLNDEHSTRVTRKARAGAAVAPPAPGGMFSRWTRGSNRLTNSTLGGASLAL